MYRLLVFGVGSPFPVEVRRTDVAADALRMVPELLQANPECERIEVHFGMSRLFAVDGKGNQLPR